jgi:hypothetical protein
METKLEEEDDSSDGDDIAVTAITAGESNGSKRKRNSIS